MTMTEKVTPSSGKMTIMHRFAERYGKWASRISGALVDQALFAGSNFVINLALANWMDLEEYGAFVVVYAWFLLLQNVYDAVVIEPMSIYGAGKHANQFQRYLGWLYYGHGAIGFIIFGILITVALVASQFNASLVVAAIFGIAVAAPFLLLRWLTRQPFYIQSRPHWSALGGAIYLSISLLIILLLYAQGWLFSYTALFALAIGSLASAGFLSLVFLRPRLRLQPTAEMNLRNILGDHWQYGRWSIADRLLGWLPANFAYVMLPVLYSLTESGALRAIMNLTLPVSLAIVAITGLLLPSFVRKYTAGGRTAVDQQLVLWLKIVTAVTGVYCLGILLLGAPLISFLFNGRYDEYVTFPLLMTMGLVPIIMAIAVVVDTALRATGRIKYAFLSKIVPAVVTVTLGTFLLWSLQLVGANLSMILVNTITISMSLWFYTRGRGQKQKNDQPEAEDPALA